MAQTPEMIVSFGVVPGTAGRTSPVPPSTSGSPQTTGATSSQDSVLPGLSSSMRSVVLTVRRLTVFPFTWPRSGPRMTVTKKGPSPQAVNGCQTRKP